MKLVITGTVESLSTRQDNTVVVKFGTQEMESSEAGKLFHFRNKYCKLLLTDDNISELESELVAASAIKSSKQKTPSQRMRAVLFRVFEQTGLEIDFEQYYVTEMERIIEHYKSKLNPI